MRFIRSCPVGYPVTSSADPGIRSGGGLSRPDVPANLYESDPMSQPSGAGGSDPRHEIDWLEGSAASRGLFVCCPFRSPVQLGHARSSGCAVSPHHPPLPAKEDQKPGGGRLA